jgi:hypothetical protein
LEDTPNLSKKFKGLKVFPYQLLTGKLTPKLQLKLLIILIGILYVSCQVFCVVQIYETLTSLD